VTTAGADDQQPLRAREGVDEGARVVEVGAAHLDAARREVREPGGAAGRRHDVAGLRLEQQLHDAPAEMSGGACDQ
jgi:hypothetical protein